MQPSTTHPFQTSQSRWRAISQRDPSAHCTFLYAVKSTKIYCRPTCSARLARRANVLFYDTVDQARRDGYRACQRCKPDDMTFLGEREEIVQRAIALLRVKRGEERMRDGLKELAREVGVTPSYLCRVFKKTMGMTVGEYIREFERVGSQDEKEESIRSTSTVNVQSDHVAPGVPAWSRFETETSSKALGTIALHDVDVATGYSTLAAVNPPAPIEGWSTSTDSSPFSCSTGVNESLNVDFDFDEWLWTKDTDLNDWLVPTDCSPNNMIETREDDMVHQVHS